MFSIVFDFIRRFENFDILLLIIGGWWHVFCQSRPTNRVKNNLLLPLHTFLLDIRHSNTTGLWTVVIDHNNRDLNESLHSALSDIMCWTIHYLFFYIPPGYLVALFPKDIQKESTHRFGHSNRLCGGFNCPISIF